VVAQKRQTQRQRDARQTRQAAQRAAQQRKAQRRRLITAVVCSAFLVLGVSAFVATGGGAKKVETTASTTTVAQRTPVSLAAVPPGAAITGDTPCPKADGTSPRTTGFAKPPPTSPFCIDPNKSYSAEVRTSKGNFVVTLDAKAAPKTVNNFVVLARYKFFEGIAFHRIIPGFVVQGGDPTTTGGGSPGYRFEDELPKQGAYKIGSVAMANSGPNTNGSQFFIITGEAGVILPPKYSLFGTVTQGMEIVKAIEAVGTSEGSPTEAVIIQSVSIRES
jgi:cyclophilin family peptidyl-prolyl cis-trans isomerase